MDIDEILDPIWQSFDFCGCGSPEDAAKFIFYGLEFIGWRLDQLKESDVSVRGPEWKALCDRLDKRKIELFGSDGAAYFFYYWADKEELTDHGGSVPGWLTDKGKAVMAELKKAMDAQ